MVLRELAVVGNGAGTMVQSVNGDGTVLLRWCCRCWCVADNGVMVMQWWPAR